MSSDGGAAEIRPMDAEAVRRIVAGQAVTDLATAVKELVDNALDAGSKSINIRLFNQGADIVEVSDDGAGVPVASRPYLATAHATSKIQSFDDLYSRARPLTTMGFRGEALFCLANLSARLVVATRTANEEMAQKLEFNRDGTLDMASVTTIPRKVGTTVAVVRLLDAVPVRRADMKRRMQQQRSKLLKWMEAYAIFAVGVRLHLMDMIQTPGSDGNDCRESTCLATTANSTSLQENISSVLGSRLLASLSAISVNLGSVVLQQEQQEVKKAANSAREDSIAADETNDQHVAGEVESFVSCKMEGWISSTQRSASTASSSSKPSDRNHNNLRVAQYYSVNGRPVDLPKVTRILNDLWRSFGQTKKPSCILQFTLPGDTLDVNLSPDKRQVVWTAESEILDVVRHHLAQLWASQTNGKFNMNAILSGPSSVADTRTNYTTTAGSDGGSEHDSDGDDSTPGKFTRRYAFSHDFAKVKLQHEYDDGRIKRRPSDTGDEPAVMQVQEASGMEHPKRPLSEQEAANAVAGDTRRKRPRVENDSAPIAQNKDTNATATSVTPSPYKTGKLYPAAEGDNINNAAQTSFDNSTATTEQRSVDQASLAERHQWHKVQTSFNHSGPGDMLQQEMSAVEMHEQSTNNPSVGVKNDEDQGQKMTSFGLEKFGFRAVKRVSYDRSERCQTSAKTTYGESDRASITTDTVSGGARRVSADSGRAEVSTSSSRTTRTRAQLSASPDGTIVPEISPEKTVWKAFKSTEQVAAQSQEHRLAMRDRRMMLREQSVDESRNTASLTKLDLKRNLTVIGQFNMGFILARSQDNHLWILDQHACDERYNFEKLCEATVIHEQRLMAPLPLELSPAEEICVLDNMRIFEQNGFRFLCDETKPPRHRLSLVALPHSGARDGRKAVQFGKEDVSALCTILGADGSTSEIVDGGTGTDGSGVYGNNAVRRYASTSTGIGDPADRVIARLPKAIAMFASRACRGSIMIGSALSDSEMDRIVKRLGDLSNPWICAHGRSTMSHVGDLNRLLAKDERKAAAHLAGPTVTVMSQMDDPEL